MKRSEMLNKIADYLWQNDIKYPDAMAQELLDLIEKEGMKPPTHQFEKTIHNVTYEYFLNQWESENEQE